MILYCGVQWQWPDRINSQYHCRVNVCPMWPGWQPVLVAGWHCWPQTLRHSCQTCRSESCVRGQPDIHPMINCWFAIMLPVDRQLNLLVRALLTSTHPVKQQKMPNSWRLTTSHLSTGGCYMCLRNLTALLALCGNAFPNTLNRATNLGLKCQTRCHCNQNEKRKSCL